jgi:hypothetical protein
MKGQIAATLRVATNEGTIVATFMRSLLRRGEVRHGKFESSLAATVYGRYLGSIAAISIVAANEAK